MRSENGQFVIIWPDMDNHNSKNVLSQKMTSHDIFFGFMTFVETRQLTTRPLINMEYANRNDKDLAAALEASGKEKQVNIKRCPKLGWDSKRRFSVKLLRQASQERGLKQARVCRLDLIASLIKYDEENGIGCASTDDEDDALLPGDSNKAAPFSSFTDNLQVRLFHVITDDSIKTLFLNKEKIASREELDAPNSLPMDKFWAAATELFNDSTFMPDHVDEKDERLEDLNPSADLDRLPQPEHKLRQYYRQNRTLWDRCYQNYTASGQNGSLDFWDFCQGSIVLLYIYKIFEDEEDLVKAFSSPIAFADDDSPLNDSSSTVPSTPVASSLSTAKQRALARAKQKEQDEEKSSRRTMYEDKTKAMKTRNDLIERQVKLQETSSKRQVQLQEAQLAQTEDERQLWLLKKIGELRKERDDCEDAEMKAMFQSSIDNYTQKYKALLAV